MNVIIAVCKHCHVALANWTPELRECGSFEYSSINYRCSHLRCCGPPSELATSIRAVRCLLPVQYELRCRSASIVSTSITGSIPLGCSTDFPRKLFTLAADSKRENPFFLESIVCNILFYKKTGILHNFHVEQICKYRENITLGSYS